MVTVQCKALLDYPGKYDGMYLVWRRPGFQDKAKQLQYMKNMISYHAKFIENLFVNIPYDFNEKILNKNLSEHKCIKNEIYTFNKHQFSPIQMNKHFKLISSFERH